MLSQDREFLSHFQFMMIFIIAIKKKIHKATQCSSNSHELTRVKQREKLARITVPEITNLGEDCEENEGAYISKGMHCI